MDNWLQSEDLSFQDWVEFGQGPGAKETEIFEGGNFIFNSWLDQELVKLYEGGGDVLGLVFQVVEPFWGFAGQPRQDTITILQTGSDEGMDRGQMTRWPESFGDGFDVTEMKESSPGWHPGYGLQGMVSMAQLQ